MLSKNLLICIGIAFLSILDFTNNLEPGFYLALFMFF